jgi:uncharacterized membrane protein SirB2
LSYTLLKALHISCVAGSYVLFFLRGLWQFNSSPVLKQRWLRIAPHIVDTLLLSSALSLAFTLQQYPFLNAWLTAKFAALLLYIILGSVALKYGSSKSMRIFAWLAAQLVFAYIVLVAISHRPFIL